MALWSTFVGFVLSPSTKGGSEKGDPEKNIPVSGFKVVFLSDSSDLLVGSPIFASPMLGVVNGEVGHKLLKSNQFMRESRGARSSF